jgi:hypothetical protein
MREVALGRKNWLFVGNVEAGERAARLMTLVSSAKRHQLDVWMYLKDILDRLLKGETDYAKFTPDAWRQPIPKRSEPTARRKPATKRTAKRFREPSESSLPSKNGSERKTKPETHHLPVVNAYTSATRSP